MKARLTTKGYSFDIDEDEMLAVLEAEGWGAVAPFATKVAVMAGVVGVDYDKRFEPRFEVFFDVGDDGFSVGFDEVSDAIQDHIHDCEAFAIYVGGSPEEAKGKKLLHAGDGFALCDVGLDGKDMGVSPHFLYDGQRAVKWFTDGAAAQFRELAAGDDEAGIKRIVGKHIDLDPPVAGPKGP